MTRALNYTFKLLANKTFCFQIILNNQALTRRDFAPVLGKLDLERLCAFQFIVFKINLKLLPTKGKYEDICVFLLFHLVISEICFSGYLCFYYLSALKNVL